MKVKSFDLNQVQLKKLFKIGQCVFLTSISEILIKYKNDNYQIQQFKKRLQSQSLRIRSASDLISPKQFWKIWKELLPKMIVCDMKYVDASNSILNINILKQINHISFDQLIRLDLSTNYLKSIETLYFLNAPKLKQILLQKNPIKYVKSLQKCKFPLMQFIDLIDNTICNLLPRTMNFKFLKGFCSKYRPNYYFYSVDKCVFSKLQTKCLQVNKISQQISQTQIKKMLSHKMIMQRSQNY